MGWGAIGKDFKSELVIFEENVTADVYIEQVIYGSNLIFDADDHYVYDRWVFQQDNARPHIALKTMEHLRELQVKLLANWPPYSPDLNIIEVVWAIMKRRLNAIQARTLADVKRVVLQVWEDLSFETINNLVEQMPKRMKALVNKNGETVFLNELE